ncbi:MAG: hypothetical protein GY711_06085 [bacterium]|nr:hypothetical protein [bacterium]
MRDGRPPKERWFRITGSSMWPLLRDGDCVLVRESAPIHRAGDIVLYKGTHQGEEIVAVHRVIRRRPIDTETGFLTCGDHCIAFDGVLRATQVYGRVVRLANGSAETSLESSAWSRVGRYVAFVHYPIGLVRDRCHRSLTSILGRDSSSRWVRWLKTAAAWPVAVVLVPTRILLMAPVVIISPFLRRARRSELAVRQQERPSSVGEWGGSR